MKEQRSKEVKKQLQNSVIDGEKYEVKDLNEKAARVEKCKDLAAVIREYSEIILTKTRALFPRLYWQSNIFKTFKAKQKFITMIRNFNVTKSTMIFKANILKLINK